MSQTHESVKQTSIIKKQESSLKEKVILKDNVTVLPIWFGSRLLDDSDLQTLQMFLPFPIHNLAIPEANDMKKADPKILRPLADNLRNILDNTKNPMAVFIITTAQSTKHPWIEQFPQKLTEYRRQYNKRDDIFIYKLVWGGWFPDIKSYEREGRFDAYEKRAHELGAVYLYFNGDAPTAGSRRLVDFMNRILGNDLPGKEFPCYTPEEVQKIEWNINRENFNGLSVREGSVPKYPIGKNGRPIFPF